jgi:putative transposase
MRERFANQCLLNIPKHFSEIKLLEFVVMPNHVHLLLKLVPPLFNHVETHHDASLTKRYQSYFHHRIAQKSTQTIPLIIKQCKSAVTKLINPKTIFFGWQERFYDEIINDKDHLKVVKYYIINNPKNWQKDEYYSLPKKP